MVSGLIQKMSEIFGFERLRLVFFLYGLVYFLTSYKVEASFFFETKFSTVDSRHAVEVIFATGRRRLLQGIGEKHLQSTYGSSYSMMILSRQINRLPPFLPPPCSQCLQGL